MRVWVTGAAGFVGRYVCRRLREEGDEVLASDVRADESQGVEPLDIRDAEEALAFAVRNRPEACIHLAGVAFVPDAAKNPMALSAINVDGAVHVARALLRVAPKGRFLFISSSQVYGYKRRESPMFVEDELRPSSPYASSKVAAEKALLELHEDRRLNLCIARPGNHTGPGQSPKFVVPSFIQAVRDVRDGTRDAIEVGNLESERDFTDVRDVVSAYLLILRKGHSGGIYNISAGQHMTIGEVLRRITTMMDVQAPVKVKPEYFRPTDAMPALNTCHMRGLGWQPRYTFDQTLRDMI